MRCCTDGSASDGHLLLVCKHNLLQLEFQALRVTIVVKFVTISILAVVGCFHACILVLLFSLFIIMNNNKILLIIRPIVVPYNRLVIALGIIIIVHLGGHFFRFLVPLLP